MEIVDKKILFLCGETTKNKILRSNKKKSNFENIGFVNVEKTNVYNNSNISYLCFNNVERNVEFNNISLLIFNSSLIYKDVLFSVLSKCIRENIQIKYFPEINFNDIETLFLKDSKKPSFKKIFKQPKITAYNRQVNNLINGKVILVTGAAGSIGSRLVFHILKFKPKALLLLDINETGLFDLGNRLNEKYCGIFKQFVADITDKENLESLFKSYAIDVIFHTAAYKHVSLLEDNKYAAIKVNVLGTKYISDLSLKYNVEKMIFISSDKAVEPAGIMGASKKVSEMYLSSLNRLNKSNKFHSIRLGNIINTRGSFLPLFKSRIKKRLDLEITHSEVKRFFLDIDRACTLILNASAMSYPQGIYVFQMYKPIKIIDIAEVFIYFSKQKKSKIIIKEMKKGEKINEKIISSTEALKKTYHNEIFVALDNNIKHLDSSFFQDFYSLKKEKLKKYLDNLTFFLEK